MVVVAVKSYGKGVIVVNFKVASLMIEIGEVDLLKKLVDDELNRRCQGIDDVVQRVYSIDPSRHTEKAIAEVKVAVLELVRSPLAELERKLACIGVEPNREPEPEPEVKLEPGVEPELEPGKEPAKSKA